MKLFLCVGVSSSVGDAATIFFLFFFLTIDLAKKLLHFEGSIWENVFLSIIFFNYEIDQKDYLF